MSRKTVSAVIGSFLVVVFALGAVQGCGSDGTGGTGTGGSNGTGGASGTGTGGTKATGGTSGTGTGGATGTGGTTSGTGGSGTVAACAVCDTAASCCTAVKSAGGHLQLSRRRPATRDGGTAQTSYIQECQMIVDRRRHGQRQLPVASSARSAVALTASCRPVGASVQKRMPRLAR